MSIKGELNKKTAAKTAETEAAEAAEKIAAAEKAKAEAEAKLKALETEKAGFLKELEELRKLKASLDKSDPDKSKGDKSGGKDKPDPDKGKGSGKGSKDPDKTGDKGDKPKEPEKSEPDEPLPSELPIGSAASLRKVAEESWKLASALLDKADEAEAEEAYQKAKTRGAPLLGWQYVTRNGERRLTDNPSEVSAFAVDGSIEEKDVWYLDGRLTKITPEQAAQLAKAFGDDWRNKIRR